MTTPQNPNMLAEAIAFAHNVHRDQKDKGGENYILHPLRIMSLMDTEAERIVAVLHDVLEDGGPGIRTAFEELRLTDEIRAAVEVLTREPNETYAAYIHRLCKTTLAKKVKIADLHDNLRADRIDNIGPEQIERYKWALHMLEDGKDTVLESVETRYQNALTKYFKAIREAADQLLQDITVASTRPGMVRATSPYEEVTVRAGQTLSGIALRHLGNADRWREIYHLNSELFINKERRKRIRQANSDDPYTIFEGDVLKLPPK